MKWKDIIKDRAWVVEDILTSSECQDLTQRAIELGIETTQSTGDIRHRNSTTVSLDDEGLAKKIFERIREHIPQEVWVGKDCSHHGLKHSKEGLYGNWTPYALNSRWRIVCYPGSGHFGPHRDGWHMEDEHHRSFITINGYLTDRPVGFGGATRFVKDNIDANLNDEGIFTTAEKDVLHRIEADKAGKAVVFFHDLLHDGEPLKQGSPPKWVFRTEIMYERDVETAPKLSSDQLQARQYLQKAEAAEDKANFLEATNFYKLAYRLDRSLDTGFG
mmetsp:Transcript_9484/g.13947  ORF Transcript_9484/g.13947 Transcript_9484/m.13947 type:complete len:274 (-) Transcript_9484:232-1053(-)|eukprot:CAMPEP_0197234318 /NCGR_PEP_ID=MMETSP1429-20130617/2084_1 /TAXON_ID=49237 /ORGANISM="Chaetoceros  sp., Strain UNC1202" /LENGTH=273 /DNA_ID=CAMNT_0042692691 /DNA_START=26 /DNA_END=847 /DNA_ORIENTATION=+